MELWALLYGMIWLAFGESVLIFAHIHDIVWVVYAHMVLGVAIVGVAYANARDLRATRVPGRVKRTANATFRLTILMGLLGVPLYFNLGAGWFFPVIGVSVYGGIIFLHLVNAFAIVTQVAAVAIAYDMWEEKEFLQETEPGVVPDPPAAKHPTAKA